MVKDFDASAVVDEFADPVISEADQVVVRVQAASLSRFDSYVARGMMRGFMEHVFPVVLGRDFAGVVERVGESVAGFTVGDAVMGVLHSFELHLGTIAEQVVVRAGPHTLVHRPASLPVLQAAAMPLAGQAALTCVDAVMPRPGDTVLVVGACGGVGGFAVQLAAAHGAHVIAAGCAGDAEYLRDFGAADVLDHRAGLLERLTQRYPDGVDALIDTVHGAATHGVAEFAPLADQVRRGGRIASTAMAADTVALSARGIISTNVMIDLLDTGALRPPRLHVFDLDDASTALKHFDNSHTTGKYVIRMP